MSNSTLDYYDHNAVELATRYETADVAEIHRRLEQAFEPGARLLELGAGSGRDAAAMVAAGFRVTLTDGSEAMLRQAVAGHPELGGRVVRHRCPAPLPWDDGAFDGVYALAMLMHMPAADIAATLAEAARVLRPGGRLFFSVPFSRDDIVGDSRDAKGRLFTNLSPEEWMETGAAAGLGRVESFENPDGLGRPGMRWISAIMERAE